MNVFERTLIGELIGIARATDGNQHLISENSTSVILTCLNAVPTREGELRNYLNLVEEVKRNMVPDCFLCANPCGRTSGHDLSRIDQEPENVQAVKLAILEQLYALAKEKPSQNRDDLLYRGLFALGLEGYSPDELKDIFPY